MGGRTPLRRLRPPERCAGRTQFGHLIEGREGHQNQRGDATVAEIAL